MAKQVLPGVYTKTMFTYLLMVALSLISRTDASVIFSCDFETSIRPPCNIVEAGISDTFDWTIGSGPTNSRDTGPDVDHTLNNTNGQYFYIEVSGREADAFATFETPQFNEAGTKCLTMWRNMYGHHIGRLTVEGVTESGDAIHIPGGTWEGGETTNAWFENKIELSDAARRVRITATHGAGSGQPHGDIAVDDLLLTTGSCSPETTTITTSTSTTTTTTVATTQDDDTTEAAATTTEEIEEETTATITTTAEMTTSFTTEEEIPETTSTPEVTTDLQATTQDVTSPPTTPGLDTSSEEHTTGGGPTAPVRSTTTTTAATTKTTTVSTSSPTTDVSTAATEKSTGEDKAVPWLIPIVVVFAIGFLLMVIILSVVVFKRQRRRAADRRNRDRNNSWDTDKNTTKVTSVSETTTDANESSTDNLYHQIYSTPDESKASKPSDTPSPPPPAVPPSRVLPAPPSRPLPDQPPPTLPRPNHHFEPYHSPHDLEPPRELAPIPPMQNPLAGFDLTPREDEPLSDPERSRRDPSPHRHHRRRRHRDEEPERRHRHRDEEPERRHRHKHRPHEHPSDGWERDGPTFAMTHDPARANRRTLDAPVSPDYIPLTMGAVPMDPIANGFYRPDPYAPPTPEDDWNWTTIPRPRVFY